MILEVKMNSLRSFLVSLVLLVVAQSTLGDYSINVDGYGFFVSDVHLNWHAAWNDCKNRGMALAYISTEADYARTKKALAQREGHSFWIGANDLSQVGNFLWVTPRQTNRMGFRQWGEGEPNLIGEERCVEMRPDRLWNNNRCEHSIKYICTY